MKTNQLLVVAFASVFVLTFLACFLIAFYYNARLAVRFYQRLFSGELGCNPFRWNRILSFDSSYVEMRGRSRKFSIIFFAVCIFIFLFFILPSIIGLPKPAPITKRAAPKTLPRVLAPAKNSTAGAVLK